MCIDSIWVYCCVYISTLEASVAVHAFPAFVSLNGAFLANQFIHKPIYLADSHFVGVASINSPPRVINDTVNIKLLNTDTQELGSRIRGKDNKCAER